jgi:hypothetical protein
VAFVSRSLTMIFEAAPDSLIGTNHWWGSFPIPWKGVVSLKSGPTGAGKVAVYCECDSHVSSNTITFGSEDSYVIKLTDADPTRLTVGGETFAIYGEPRTIRIGKDGTIR